MNLTTDCVQAQTTIAPTDTLLYVTDTLYRYRSDAQGTPKNNSRKTARLPNQ